MARADNLVAKALCLAHVMRNWHEFSDAEVRAVLQAQVRSAHRLPGCRKPLQVAWQDGSTTNNLTLDTMRKLLLYLVASVDGLHVPSPPFVRAAVEAMKKATREPEAIPDDTRFV